MLKFLFTRRWNFLDIQLIVICVTLLGQGAIISAVLVMLVGCAISACGEIKLRETQP